MRFTSSSSINGALRAFSTSSSAPTLAARVRPQSLLQKSNLRQSFRRGYADEIRPTATIVTEPIVKKPKRFRTLRWIWRLTYLSAIGGVAYLGYGVWDLRNPEEQFQPDENKQNLVILGMTCIRQTSYRANAVYRYWLGSCVTFEEARH